MSTIWLKVVFSGPSWKIGFCLFVAKMLGVEYQLFSGGGGSYERQQDREKT